MKGTYVLLLRVDKNLNLKTRAKNFQIPRGVYVYVGSALLDLNARLKRHERRAKRKFWHIDYLLENSELILSLAIIDDRRLESSVARALSGEPIPAFGASDTRDVSHLFRYGRVEEALSDAFKALTGAVLPRSRSFPRGKGRGKGYVSER